MKSVLGATPFCEPAMAVDDGCYRRQSFPGESNKKPNVTILLSVSIFVLGLGVFERCRKKMLLWSVRQSMCFVQPISKFFS